MLQYSEITMPNQYKTCVATDNAMKKVLLLFGCVFKLVLLISAISDDSCGQTDTGGAGWKWHVQLLHVEEAPAHAFQCSGTLLNKLFVSSAAHCLYDLNGDPIDKSRLEIVLADGENRSIVRTFQPELFDVEGLSNDFVLIQLDREVLFNGLVAPICLPEPYTVLPQSVQTPMLDGTTLSVNEGYICLNDAKTLFGMIYMDAICLGQFDKTHTYHRTAGSGLYVEHRSRWHLVGIAMYGTGPTKAHIAYIGGFLLERHLNWTRSVMNHYSESIPLSEKNCQTYVRNSNLPFEEYHPIVHLVAAEQYPLRTICHGTLISPRYVLTTSRCALKTKSIFIHYGAEGSSDWFEAKDFSTSGSLALIALDHDAKENSSILSCLYSRVTPSSFNYTTRIAHMDSFVRLEGIRVQYRVDEPLKVQYYCSRYLYHGHFTSPGDALVVKDDGEPFYRVVGVLEDVLNCEPFDYFYERGKTVEVINVEKYLPWIENVVWGYK